MNIFKKIKDELDKHGGLCGSISVAKRIYDDNGIEGIKYIIYKKRREVFQAGMKKGVGLDFEREYLMQYASQYSRGAIGEYVKQRSETVVLNNKDNPLKLIAYYLPQYYPFKENNEWWGKGFTEWRNVTKSIPLFVGQHQPKLPADLGFYDLRVKQTQLEQINIAKQYGIYGFCYYYYWFSGKKLMDLPLNSVLCNKELDMPFCICWANENWTRNWDGNQKDILIKQEYNEDDPLKFIKDIIPIITDDRYIKVSSKPMILVYSIADIPSVENVIKIWRDYALEIGIPGLYLVAVKRIKNFDYKKYGFDAMVDFPPHGLDWIPLKEKPVRLANKFEGGLWDYREFVQQAKHNVDCTHDDCVEFHGVMPSWDNTARRPDGKANIFMKAEPREYKKWLSIVCKHTDAHHVPDEKMVFINAWNEWAESACLEPDNKYGYGYLEATAQVLEEIDNTYYEKNNPYNFMPVAHKDNNVAVVLHLFYGELWEEINNYLHKIERPFDLYISVPKYFSQNIMNIIKNEYNKVHFVFSENKGRDILPFLCTLKEIENLGYTCVCKIHSKKSTHLDNKKGWKKGATGKEWRNELYSEILNNEKSINAIIDAFEEDTSLGVIGPQKNYMKYKDAVGGNKSHIKFLDKKFGMKNNKKFGFFAGSMFWFRPIALKGLWNISINNFEEEYGQVDGTMAHAIERIICKYAENNGYKIKKM